MVALADVLSAVSIEARSDALELAHQDLDERYAQVLAANLTTLLPRLPQGDLNLACQGLISQLLAAGARAMTEAVLTGPSASPVVQAARDAALLGNDNPLLVKLAGDLSHCAQDAQDYWQDAALPALLGVAEAASDLRLLDAERAALREVVDVVATSPRSQRISTRTYTVFAGQTLPDIAEGFYGDRDRWPDLVRDYGLYPPYLSETPEEGKFSPGTRLLLPPDREDLETDGLGITFALDASAGPRGGQVWDLIAQDGAGLATDRGLTALATDLALRAATPFGSLDGERDYGVAVVAGQPGSRGGVYAQIVASEALRLDPRVERVVIDASRTSVATGVFVADVIVIPRPELLGG